MEEPETPDEPAPAIDDALQVPELNSEQVELLRALTRYALGCSTRIALFGKDESVLSRHDLDNFRRGQSSLQRKRKAFRLVYFGIKRFFRGPVRTNDAIVFEHPVRIQNIVSELYDAAEERPFRNFGPLAYLHYRVDERVVRKEAEDLCGHYFTYRRGAVAFGGVEIVKSFLHISTEIIDGRTYLRFSIEYPKGAITDAKLTGRITGIVMPKAGLLFFMGTDAGARDLPCLWIAQKEWVALYPDGPQGAPRTELILTGSMLRRNSMRRVAAMLVVAAKLDDASLRSLQSVETSSGTLDAARVTDAIGFGIAEQTAHEDVPPWLWTRSQRIMDEAGPWLERINDPKETNRRFSLVWDVKADE